MRFSSLLAGIVVFTAAQAFSQTNPGTDAARAALKAAFEETLRKPADPPTLLRYAEAAIQAGDLEAAISALERLLLIDDDQPRVKLELGTLYFRLGSYEQARVYFEGARNSARATAEVKQRAGQYIADLDSRTGKSTFSGDLFVALRHSTNANSGPAGLISSFGTNTVPSPNVSERPDFSVLTAAVLRHRYDLGRQDNGAFESDLTFYTARQFTVAEAHVLLLDATFGPRTEPFDGWLDDLSVKPFITGRYVSVHHYPSYWAWGMGFEFSAPLHEQVTGSLTLFGRRRAFINNPDSDINDRSSGSEGVGNLEFRVELTPTMTMSLNTNFTRYIAAVHSESYNEYGFGMGMSVRFTDPLGINGRLWSITGSVSVQLADYDQPDVSVDPGTRRHQVDTNLGLILAIPLDGQVTMIGQATYIDRKASLNNYAYRSFTSLIGLGWRF